MALKAILESLDGLSDEFKKLYNSKDGKFHLDVEGLIPKAKLDEFRDTNIALAKEKDALTEKLKAYGDVDPAKVKELQATELKLKENKLIEAGKFDELFNSKFDPINKKHQEEREADKKEKERLTAQLETLMIDEQLTKLATEKGLRPTAIPDMLGRLRPLFKIKDGKVVALDAQGATKLTDNGQPFTMDHSIAILSKDAGHLFQSSSGGGANGSGNGSNGMKTLTRAEFSKLEPDSQMAFSKEVTAKKAQLVE